jgi:hypothetical protein
VHRPHNLINVRSRIPALLLATALAAVPISVRTEEMKPGGVDIRSLEEVRWLSELPEAEQLLVGGILRRATKPV